ncbi:hypothetical protein RBSH_03715 [Rhodopirellula baltica SH28]|uniref:Uncharacterized protein n=2 Tax=Rhodopirellula baltica TaxID=265606 RepID=K5E5I5_RHOBT|nr:hypothetical protein RBSH_03715 [Rhodopirellula baltica SH28]ELP31383.1 hypothetical protein RBSWK_04701 [Rhodopirellula baltica SWK14]
MPLDAPVTTMPDGIGWTDMTKLERRGAVGWMRLVIERWGRPREA